MCSSERGFPPPPDHPPSYSLVEFSSHRLLPSDLFLVHLLAHTHPFPSKNVSSVRAETILFKNSILHVVDVYTIVNENSQMPSEECPPTMEN